MWGKRLRDFKLGFTQVVFNLQVVDRINYVVNLHEHYLQIRFAGRFYLATDL